LNESHDADGRAVRVSVFVDEGELVLDYEDREVVLAFPLVEAVFERFAKPLDPTIVPRGVRLEVGARGTLSHLRHLARYDVVARDYVVLERPGKEPLAELCTAIAAALVHVAERAS
jgi:hypothetical protein